MQDNKSWYGNHDDMQTRVPARMGKTIWVKVPANILKENKSSKFINAPRIFRYISSECAHKTLQVHLEMQWLFAQKTGHIAPIS